MNATENQKNNDTTYTAAYHAWVGSLSPEGRAELDALNLAEPDTLRTTGKHDYEKSLSRAAAPSACADENEDCQHANGSATNRRDVADALASFCARVRSHPNPLMALDSLCFATGLMEMEGLTQTALARRHGVTTAGFSKQVHGWIDLFDLRPASGCHSALARQSYSRARRAYLERKSQLPVPPPMVRPGRLRKRYHARAEDPTVVYVRGLDSFRLWFQRRTRSRPLHQWTPDARKFLLKELAWFVKLHERLAK
jgi:hypothetical protein